MSRGPAVVNIPDVAQYWRDSGGSPLLLCFFSGAKCKRETYCHIAVGFKRNATLEYTRTHIALIRMNVWKAISHWVEDLCVQYVLLMLSSFPVWASINYDYYFYPTPLPHCYPVYLILPALLYYYYHSTTTTTASASSFTYRNHYCRHSTGIIPPGLSNCDYSDRHERYIHRGKNYTYRFLFLFFFFFFMHITYIFMHTYV